MNNLYFLKLDDMIYVGFKDPRTIPNKLRLYISNNISNYKIYTLYDYQRELIFSLIGTPAIPSIDKITWKDLKV